MSKTGVATDKYMEMYSKVKNENGAINKNDRIFFSIFLIDEMECNWTKLVEFIHYNEQQIKFQEKIEDADVYVLDAMIFKKLSEAWNSSTDKKAFDPSTYKYWEEYTLALKLGKRIIDFSDWNRTYQERLTTIDEKMFNNIKNMLSSSDEETLNVAVSIMSCTNRTDSQTVTYLQDLIKLDSDTKLRNNVDFRELVAFLAKID